MVGVRPMCIGLILGVMVSLAVTNYYVGHVINLAAVGIGLLDLLLLMKYKLSIPKVILISAVLGGIFC